MCWWISILLLLIPIFIGYNDITDYSICMFLAVTLILVLWLVFKNGQRVWRKLLASYCNLHYESCSISVNWDLWSIEFQITRLINWINWFEHPALTKQQGSYLNVPQSLIYQQNTSATKLQSPKMFAGRVPLERWEDRGRLALICIDRLHLSIHLFPSTSALPLVRLHMHGVRSHQPQWSRKIETEQKAIFPDGYPNYIRQWFSLYQRIEWLLRPLVERILHQADIRLTDCEVHGLLNPVYDALGNTANIINDFDGDKSKRLLAVTVDCLQLRYNRLGRQLRAQVKQLRASEGLDFVLRQSRGIFSLSQSELVISLRRLIDESKTKTTTTASSDALTSGQVKRQRSNSAALRRDYSFSLFDGPVERKQNMSLEISVQISIEPRIHFDPVFISKLSLIQLGGGKHPGLGLLAGMSIAFGRFVTLVTDQGSQFISGYYTEKIGLTQQPLLIHLEW